MGVEIDASVSETTSASVLSIFGDQSHCTVKTTPSVRLALWLSSAL